MEKRKIQRIVGIVVVISLVIVILPLLFGGNNTPLQAKTLTDASDQPMQNNTQPGTEAALKQQKVSNDSFDPNDFDLPMIDETKSLTISDAPATIENAANPAPSDTAATNQAKPPVKPTPIIITNNSTPEAPANTPEKNVAPRQLQLIEKSAQFNSAAIENDLRKEEKRPEPTKIKAVTASKVNSNQILTKLAKAGWAVQMGSFKVKANADRLTDQLRAAGFKAFTREIKSAKGARTKVFIGPEFQQASAKKLSNQVAQQLNLKGYIVPFKPLEI